MQSLQTDVHSFPEIQPIKEQLSFVNAHTRNALQSLCSFYLTRWGCLWQISSLVRDLSEISRGEGGWKKREGHKFLRLRKGRGHKKWAIKRGRVMQIYARDHVEVPTEEKGSSLFDKKKNNGILCI